MTAVRGWKAGTGSSAAASVEDAEPALSALLAAQRERGPLRRRLVQHPVGTVRAAVHGLRLLLLLPVMPVRLPAGDEAEAVLRLLSGYRLDRLLTLGAAAVLPIPAEPGAYRLGRDRMTVRRKVRAAERQGVVVRLVPTAERRALVSLANEHERTNERVEYRIERPENDDLLGYDLWLAAYSSVGAPLVLAVIPCSGTWSVLRHFRTLVSSPESSSARYLLSAALVDELGMRGVRHLVDPLPPRWLPNGLRHFQRMVGFRLVRLGRARVIADERRDRS